ncbi:MAG: ABC transporter permease [Planctomycetaceae bacterium]|nr:ABC transporter permease [Planctomycetaceae bacterium]
MRAYFAVLKDSFREALASRVLWILLIVTTVVLLLAAPMGLREGPPPAPPTVAQTTVTDPQTADSTNPDAAKAEPKALYMTYLGFDAPWKPFPISREQATPILKMILVVIMNFFVGTLGVFTAILVTSSIIPQTYEPGAIDLLLSKPVSRSLLFLTKFAGGCAFIALIAAQFIVGLWLIMGLRFEMWNGRILLCIPIFLFLFAIYYSVSALAGVVWRNAIVSVVVSILFWVSCFVVGFTKGLIEQLGINPNRIVKIIPAGEALLGVNEQGLTREWKAESTSWQEVFSSATQRAGPGGLMVPQPLLGPIYDPQGDRLLAIQTPPRGGFSLFGPSPTLHVGLRAEGWKRTKGPNPPAGATGLFVNGKGEVLVVGASAVYRLTVDPEGAVDGDNPPQKFVAAGPEPALQLDSSAASTLNSASGAIAIWDRGKVLLLEPDVDGKYTRKLEKELPDVKKATAAVSAFGNQTVLLALSDGRVLILDAADLGLRAEFKPAGGNAPRFAAAAPGGRWLSVLFHDNRLWVYDTRDNKPVELSISGQRDVSAATFDGPDHLLVADRGTRVTGYQLDPFQVDQRRAPTLGILERVYRYGIVPIYTVFPKPGEIDNVTTYLITDQETLAVGPNAQDLAQTRVKVDVWGPVWSCLAFLAVMLGVTCLYVRRTDF